MNEREYAQMLFRASCPNNDILYDEKGDPSVMVFIPKFRMDQVVTGGSSRIHPAFVVNGRERDGFYVSKYQNCEVNGSGSSLPMKEPCNDVDIVMSLEKSGNKGTGWHLMTVQEWGALALWCKRNDFLPYGNNDHGKDKRERAFRAVPAAWENGRAKRVLTGSGPLTWSHDGTAAGVWDLNGNVSEWVGGIRFVYGELQLLPDNDGADVRNICDDAWRAVDAATGSYVLPDGKGTTPGTVKAEYESEPFDFAGWGSHWVFTGRELTGRADTLRRCDMSSILVDESVGPEARELLVALGLIYDEPYYDYKEQYAYLNNGCPETFMYRGGYWASGAFAGVFCWSCCWGKGHPYEGNGFRTCYIPLDE